MATRTKRILSVQTIRDGGGGETGLIRMIRELGADGWECHVAVPSTPRLAEQYAAAGAVLHIVPMQRLTLSGSRLTWAARYAGTYPVSVLRLAVLARRLDVDLVHTNSLHFLQGWAAARLARRPHVWHARELVVQSPAALRLERWLARHEADVVVAMSKAIAAQLDPGNVVLVYDDPDPVDFAPSRAGRVRPALGIPDTAPVVAAACRIDTWKGVDVLLDAVPALRAARPDAEVVVAGAAVGGKEDYADGLARRAAALGVHWLGARGDMPDLLADVDVFVQLSTEPEPFGLSVVEALASGCPVVATDGGGPVEILADVATEDGRSVEGGRLVPFRDPAATAAAVAALLPAATSAELRRSRPRLVPRLERGASVTDVFAEVAASRR